MVKFSDNLKNRLQIEPQPDFVADRLKSKFVIIQLNTYFFIYLIIFSTVQLVKSNITVYIAFHPNTLM